MNEETKEQFETDLVNITELKKRKYTIDKKLDHMEETLTKKLKDRYPKIQDDNFAKVKLGDICDELNLILRAALLDERKLIKIDKVSGDHISDNYCISRAYGFKVYKCWGSSSFLGYRDSNISVTEEGNLHVDKAMYGFSVLKNNSLIDQARIDIFFEFLKRVARLNKYYNRKIRKTKTENQKLLNEMENFMRKSYFELDVFKDSIIHLDDYDQIYQLLISGAAEFDKKQDKLMADLKEYNQPYRTLIKLKD